MNVSVLYKCVYNNKISISDNFYHLIKKIVKYSSIFLKLSKILEFI